MLVSLRTVMAVFLLSVIPLRHGGSRPFSWLTPQESTLGLHAALVARHGAGRALRWLDAQSAVAQTRIAGDVIVVRFRDGRQIALSLGQSRPAINWASAVGAFLRARGDAPVFGARAEILEPFYSQIPGEAAAEPGEVDALRQAGFQVDVRRGSQVTVAALEQLAQYSMTYLDSHENVWGRGNAIIMTGETNPAPYGPLLRDGSLIPTVVVGQSPPVYYNAVTSTFFARHVGTFLPHSIAFFNGCSVLQATQLWQAMQNHDLATFISWDQFTLDAVAVPAGQFLMAHLWQGETVSQSVAATALVGLGTSRDGNEIGHLGFRGDGNDTLAQAVAGATAPFKPGPSATATSTPIPFTP